MNLETYISEFSKYVIAAIMALYMLESILAIIGKNENRKKGIYARQNLLMFAFHFSSFMVICFETEEISYLIFYVFQQIILYAAIMLYKSIYPKTNRLIINNLCMFLSISFVILTRLDYAKAIKQFIIASASIILALIIPFFIRNIKFFKNLKWIYAAIGILSLGIMMILGQTTYGSKISYTIAGVSFQPAEVVKLVFVFFIASALYKSKSILDVFTSGTIAAIHVIIQVLNKDLGSALIFFIVYICMLFIASGRFIYLLLGMMMASGASMVAFRYFSHIRVRVQAWMDPWSYIDSSGYQITQSLFALSSGGWFGLGLFKGTPNSIPFVEDDFIFSAIAEEFGIIFAVCLILLCLLTFIMIMKIAINLEDKFYQLISAGLGITYIFQVFLTVGGGTKFIPLTGVTLPLVSYGGSSVLITIMMFAIIEGLYMISVEEYVNTSINEEYADSERPVAKKKRNRLNTGSDLIDNKNIEKRSKVNNRNNRNNRNRLSDDYEEDRLVNKKKINKRENHNNLPLKSSNKKSKNNTHYKQRHYAYDEYEEFDNDHEIYEEEYYMTKDRYGSYEYEESYEEDLYEDEMYDEAYDDETYDETYDDEAYDDEVYEDEAYDESDEYDQDSDDDIEFIHGFTIPIDADLVNELVSEEEDENFPGWEEKSVIYYNEEEYEKDKKREKKENK